MPQTLIASQLPFSPEPPGGRVFEGTRLVRSTDVRPDGRFRFDALARALEDVAVDDVAGTGWRAPYAWLLRRCAVTVHSYPRFADRLTLRTFCSATGPRWAQRTTTVSGADGPLMQSVAIWAAVDLASGQPVPLGDDFFRFYGEATQGRKVSARLSLPKPEPATEQATGPGAEPAPEPGARRDWPLRAADFDTAGHVNNAIAWAAAEDVLAALDWLPARAEVEYHRPMLPGCQPQLLVRAGHKAGHRASHRASEREVFAWLMDGDGRLATARLHSPEIGSPEIGSPGAYSPEVAPR
jgi:acyl-ACP thioesterase